MINRCRRAPFLASYQDLSIYLCDCADWAPSRQELVAAARFSARDVDDPPALFVADPFLALAGDRTYLFFELMPRNTLRGVIGVAHSRDRRHWTYGGVVLREPFHLSFPNVFRRGDDWFMVPECAEQGEVRLYRAVSFPTEWTFERTLLEGRFADSVLWEHDGTWFMASSPRMETLRLFVAPDPLGPWTEHPRSPIVEGDLSAARPAGPPIPCDGVTVRLAQDCRGTYGRAVGAFRIESISAEAYSERPCGQGPVLGPGAALAPQAQGMHHLHAQRAGAGRWIVACDAWRMRRTWARRVLLPAIDGSRPNRSHA